MKKPMSQYNILHLHRLFTEAEQLEFRLLHAYYHAATTARHHRLLSICYRAHERKHRRRTAYLAAIRSTRQAQPHIDHAAVPLAAAAQTYEPSVA